MPRREDLPAELAALARRNAFALDNSDWHSGVGRLVAVLQGVVVAGNCSDVQPGHAGSRALVRKARTPDAGELAQKRALGPAEPAGADDARLAGERGDLVDCTVFAPTLAGPGDAVFVQVFAHLVEEAAEARRLAQEFDAETERRAFKTLDAIVPRGSTLMFELQMGGSTVADRVQSLVWAGRPASVQFEVRVPDGTRPGAYVGAATVSLDSVPVGHVKFKLAVVPPERHGERRTEPVGDDATRYRKAFVSYSSKDRQAVLERVQMLKPLGIEYFQDLLDLDPGDRWERKLDPEHRRVRPLPPLLGRADAEGVTLGEERGEVRTRAETGRRLRPARDSPGHPRGPADPKPVARARAHALRRPPRLLHDRRESPGSLTPAARSLKAGTGSASGRATRSTAPYSAPASASTRSCSPTASANPLCACSPPKGRDPRARRARQGRRRG